MEPTITFYEYEPVTLEVEDFASEGYVLDIGGGGEGVIGMLKGRDVVAIDLRKEELEEAYEGPLKIQMDARDLKFLDHSFNTVTAFFSLMYLKTTEDQSQVMAEVNRVLKPGGTFHCWEVDLSELPPTDRLYYVVRLCCRVGEREFETGYGQKWPPEARGLEHYTRLAQAAGLRLTRAARHQNTFHLTFQKE